MLPLTLNTKETTIENQIPTTHPNHWVRPKLITQKLKGKKITGPSEKK